MYIIRIHY